MTRLAALALALVLGAGCGVIRPIGALSSPRLAVSWAAELEALPTFAYRPREAGVPLYVGAPDAAAPPRVVVPSRDRRVRAFDATTGAFLWAFETRGPNVARPTPVGDDVLVGSMDGRVYRLALRNGLPVWASEPVGRGTVLSAPAVAGDVAFVTSDDNRLTALGLADGARRWDRSRPHRGEFTITGQAGATVLGDAVLTGFSDGQLVAFAVADGATLWSADLTFGGTEFVDVDTTPLPVGDLVVVAGYRSGLHGVEAANGVPRWRLEGEGYGTPALKDETLYVPQAGGRLLAVDGATGDVRWAARLGEGVPRPPAVTENYVLLPTDSTLLLIDRGTGRTLQRYDDAYGFTATPEVAWGTVYAQANSGHLYALGIW